ncbi:MAG TPA: MarR family transcriptional regulator [Alcanivorax sp.]|jgi:DNA-binding MarR family transcriptional regulator|uniref:Transcriptional regulator, MarR family protein n=1 Tax=Alloalcanivorax venustensis ISO4 TaxID=1177184 RepID=A0ABS0AFL8_9GAMM|nr:helix-turn-helix domain-containing protein [Alloalcanivorax venustensis]MAD69708.1 MarR family transcriptional regulator [Alcanivorax sp.]MEA3258748.1 helix-turn-helix domain-containing protein [Pseudomonadota bacterium]MAK21009.1 MarR family transcriptional regulator [Alcanivorax sp.]MBA4730707.1 MarR family transcriptional regulator [Alcanivorax sp.]MBF5052060.1 transcriptional regulator, MarR family protein [Alloalcanivorax venustensis ISO4]|tara:strand:- start:1357 stop:1797 length:441 start_codon:yes stop_codon:yes gene_type:complete
MVEDASLDRLNKYLETLHFAFRGLVAEPDSILKSQGLSRIHHRLLFFIGRNPGLSVNELVESMRLTKQAIHKPLKSLVEKDLVEVTRDASDKRVKRLALTSQGVALESRLTGIQRELLTHAFDEVGEEGAEAWFRVMETMARRLGV